MIRLSVVICTKNRLPYFKRVIENLREDPTEKEFIVMYSEDDKRTQDWLKDQTDIIALSDNNTKNHTSIYNKGFKAASNEYIANWTDDIIVVPGAFDAGIEILDNDKKAAAVVFKYNPGGKTMFGYSYQIHREEKRFFLNFGIIRKSILEEFNYWNEEFPGYYTLNDFCARIFEAGLSIKPVNYEVWHTELVDATKMDLRKTITIGQKLFKEKWGRISRRNPRECEPREWELTEMPAEHRKLINKYLYEVI